MRDAVGFLTGLIGFILWSGFPAAMIYKPDPG